MQESPFTDQGSVVDIFTDMTVWMGIRKVIDQINANAMIVVLSVATTGLDIVPEQLLLRIIKPCLLRMIQLTICIQSEAAYT